MQTPVSSKVLLSLSLGLTLSLSIIPFSQAQSTQTETKTTTTKTSVFPGDATVTETTTRTRIEERIPGESILIQSSDKTVGNISAPDGSIEINKDGTVYPIPVRFIAREVWYQDTPEAAYMGVYSANRIGDPAWIVAGFLPDEADEISAMVYDEAMLTRNTALAQSIVNETIVGRESYKDYTVLRVRIDMNAGESRVVRMPFKQINGRWYLTNDLQGDAAFVPVE